MSAVEALLAGLVDYAGLFPPASQDMRSSLESYASYLNSADRPAIARFIVPLSRLSELEETGNDLLPRGTGSEPWKLSVLVSGEPRLAGAQILEFNEHHDAGSDGHALIDVVELKATSAREIEEHRSLLPRFVTPYFEISTSHDVAPLTRAIAAVGARAKIRTGGVTADAFPAASEILDFMTAARRDSVAFKATAGLHHPVRGSYPLTYATDSPRGTMYGFLNLFLAATILYCRSDANVALSVLEESDTSAFTFREDGISWRDTTMDGSQIRAARSQFAISFGSCSFREPVDELRELAGNPILKTT
ncbi:MAG: hypothetical protein ACREMS_05840 [Gemmatimonadaceae bacterium]